MDCAAGLPFYDFFAGVGMAEVALSPDWRCIWANDFDERKARVHAANANLDHSIYALKDIATVAPSELPGNAAMAWASFPCQDLSLAGWRRGMSTGRSGAFWPFWQLMRDLHDEGRRPPLIAIENVAGLLYGPSFAGLCEALAAINMSFGALLIDADRFLPQSRPRVFIVAVDRELDTSDYVDSTPSGPWLPKNLIRAHASLSSEVREHWRWWHLPVPSVELPDIRDIIQSEPESVEWHSAAETERLLSLMSPVNAEKVASALARSERSVGFAYRRTRTAGQRVEVRFDGVAGCLRTPYGGSSRQTVIVVEGGVVRSRLLAPREAARLMGLPDDFVLPARYNDAYRAMGDGVAAPVVRWLGEHLLTPLAQKALASHHQPTTANGDVLTFRRAAESAASEWALARA
jgi:DNA (cytosine-5)-methyltransferase 1